MPPSSTTQGQNTLPAYKVRTMAEDIEALKKGTSPSQRTITITPVPVQPTTTLTPKPKEETAARAPMEPTQKVKPVFPKISDANLKAESPLPGVTDITPRDHALAPSRPVRPQVNQPFNAPISKPMPPLEPKNITPPPMDLPVPPQAPSAPPPRPLTPPPLRSAPPPGPARPMPPLPPATKAGPVLPPLPPLPKTPLAHTRGGSFNKRILILAALAVALVVFIIGEIWWFFLRTPGTPLPEVVTEQTTDTLPPPQELMPLLPANEIQPTASEPVLPEPILSYDRTETVTAEGFMPAAISAAIDGFDLDSVAADELVRLVIKPAAPDQDTSEPVSLDSIVKGLGLRIPTAVKQNLAGEFDLFVFGANTFDEEECSRRGNTVPACWGPRWGLALKTSDPVKTSSALKNWERTMVSDLKPMILAKVGQAASASFLTGTYQGETIRYKNLPLNTTTAEYALADDVLIIATSKNSMLKAIDSLNPSGGSNELGE